MAPKQPPTLKKPIESDSSSSDKESKHIKTNTKGKLMKIESDSEKSDEESKPIEIKTNTKGKLMKIESDSENSDEESKPIEIKTNTKGKLMKIESGSEKIKKEIEPKLNDMTLLINILNEEEEIVKKLSDLHKKRIILIKKLSDKPRNLKLDKPRNLPEPLKFIPEVIQKFIGCDEDVKYTLMQLSQEIRKQLIPNGKEQIITQRQLKELNINDEGREELELDEVIKNDLKKEVSEKLDDKKEKYYRVKFGKLLSIASFINKQ